MKRSLLVVGMVALVVTAGTVVAEDVVEAPFIVMESRLGDPDFIGLVPEGIRLDGHASGFIIDGLFAGAMTKGVDYLLYRHDGVGVLDIRGFAVHPDGATAALTLKGFLGEPMPGLLQAMFDPAFEFPDVDIPVHGAAWIQTMAPEYAFLNHTVFGCQGVVDFVEAVARITCRSLAP